LEDLILHRSTAAALLFACHCHAQPAEGVKPATVEGQVVNAKTGQPIRRANLTLRPLTVPAGTGGGNTIMMQQAAPYAVSSDGEGKFRFENVEPGVYRLGAERQGFVRHQYGARTAMSGGTPLRLAAGDSLKKIDMKMTPQAVITGRIYDEEGEPLARAQVQIVRRQYIQGKEQFMPMQGGMSSDNGDYRISDLMPGRYWVIANVRRMSAEPPARNQEGKPQEDYITTYYPSATDQPSARAIELEGGQEATGIDIRMLKGRVYRIRGKLVGASTTDKSSSGPAVRIMLMPRQRSGMVSFMGTGANVREDGSFEIGNVPSGSYHLIAMPAQQQGMPTISAKVPIEVTRNDLEDVALTVTPSFTLRGSVRVDGDVQQLEQAQGKKMSFASLRVQLSPFEGTAFMAPPGGSPKDDGSFILENTSPDKYRVMVYNPPRGTWIKSIRAGDQEVLETGMDASSGSPGPIEITLGLGVGQISGTVQAADQQPAAGSQICLVPEPPKPERPDLFRLVMADQTGRFTMESVPPGTYRVYAWSEIDFGRLQDPELLKKYETKAQKVTIKENGQEQLTLTQIVAEP
jgi:protocatechuate 3,4-dioxygenase beta subunit